MSATARLRRSVGDRVDWQRWGRNVMLLFGCIVQFVDLAILSAEVKVGRGVDTLAVPQGDFDGRFLGSLTGAGWSGSESDPTKHKRSSTNERI